MFPMPARTQNISQVVLSKPIPCQIGPKIYFNSCWTNISHAWEDTKYIWTCVHKSYPMPAWTQNSSLSVLTKRLPFQRGQIMHLNTCCPNPSHASKDKKGISTCVEQTALRPTRIQNISQLVLIKLFPCLGGHKIYLNMCWPNPYHASEDTPYELTKAFPCQLGHNLYFNMCWPNPSHDSKNTICISCWSK